MKADVFAAEIRKAIVEENTGIYRDLFENTKSATDPYWVRALALYSALDEDQRNVFIEVVRQTAIDMLDSQFADYDAGKINNGPTRDQATRKAFVDAISKMKKDLAAIPPNGVSNIGNVKRKTFTDSKGNIWRIDLENLAGKNLTK